MRGHGSDSKDAKALSHYAVLGISPTASQDEVKKAFRQLARIKHPDVLSRANPNASEEEQTRVINEFKPINDAYEVLRDPDKRRQYDQELNANSAQSGASAAAASANDYSQSSPAPQAPPDDYARYSPRARSYFEGQDFTYGQSEAFFSYFGSMDEHRERQRQVEAAAAAQREAEERAQKKHEEHVAFLDSLLKEHPRENDLFFVAYVEYNDFSARLKESYFDRDWLNQNPDWHTIIDNVVGAINAKSSFIQLHVYQDINSVLTELKKKEKKNTRETPIILKVTHPSLAILDEKDKRIVWDGYLEASAVQWIIADSNYASRDDRYRTNKFYHKGESLLDLYDEIKRVEKVLSESEKVRNFEWYTTQNPKLVKEITNGINAIISVNADNLDRVKSDYYDKVFPKLSTNKKAEFNAIYEAIIFRMIPSNSKNPLFSKDEKKLNQEIEGLKKTLSDLKQKEQSVGQENKIYEFKKAKNNELILNVKKIHAALIEYDNDLVKKSHAEFKKNYTGGFFSHDYVNASDYDLYEKDGAKDLVKFLKIHQVVKALMKCLEEKDIFEVNKINHFMQVLQMKVKDFFSDYRSMSNIDLTVRDFIKDRSFSLWNSPGEACLKKMDAVFEEMKVLAKAQGVAGIFDDKPVAASAATAAAPKK